MPTRPQKPKGSKPKSSRSKALATQSHTTVGARLAIGRGGFFVPPTKRFTHKYVDNFIITSGAAGVFGTVYSYAANGMYDPYLGAGGHQPYGFDELSPWYNSYCVTAISVNITMMAPSSGTALLGLAWRPSGGSFNPAGLGIGDFAEKDNTRYVWVPSSPANSKDVTISFGTFQIARLEGKKPSQILAENEFQGTPAGNPASVPQLMICMADAAGASSTTAALIVELTYHATWRGPKTFGQS